MKSTGIIRKLDDLGRIVLPKELRITMNLGNNAPFEIHFEDGMIILTKYDETSGLSGIVRRLDDLGRIVLPKELRNMLNLNKYEPFEVFVDEDKIILKQFVASNACMVTGVVDENNFSFDSGKIIVSKNGAEILIKELQEFIAK
ncbi:MULTISPECIES: AbrB/MazE/SpoVT family DNA-binding domain-containing protein [unclassified Bacillus (in: firmicutes)]|uniref:AbrB/MazE/SpoVT family DNA-binding domain-containing protein n=1 Tax=Bacillaceae TaxID=186817 RepID=UPI0011557071|nr:MULTISPECIES: AbrB/MazE/SpoVT family DNA-binding domain-containing protein [unclassified Bacillus (in: firmicutes)]QKE75661.1 AbrB family transcriptional regulator [Arthrobacter citreus]